MSSWNKGFLLIGCLMIVIGFQNCIQSAPASFAGPENKVVEQDPQSGGDDGQPYDGKIYLLLGDICPDQTNIQAKILLKTFTSATLVREKCNDITPINLSTNDFQLNPTNSDEMNYQTQLFLSVAPTQVIGTKVDLSITLADGGFGYRVNGNFGTAPDVPDMLTASKLQLFEDGIALGPAHSLHDDIRNLGQGRFSHKDGGTGEALRFSASDNTDPRSNGRIYSYKTIP